MKVDTSQITGHNTAISRKAPSAPMKLLDSKGLLVGERRLDYGCGRGFDADHFEMIRYDPHWHPELPKGKFDLIVCNYVLNVVSPEEGEQVLSTVQGLLAEGGLAYFAVRRDLPKEGKPGRGCFQRYVELDLDLVVETSAYAIYRMAFGRHVKLELETGCNPVP